MHDPIQGEAENVFYYNKLPPGVNECVYAWWLRWTDWCHIRGTFPCEVHRMGFTVSGDEHVM